MRPLRFSRLHLLLLALALPSFAQADLPLVAEIKTQPLRVHTTRLVEALNYLGQPLPDSVLETFAAASPEELQRMLDPYCLLAVTINPESRVSIAAGPARPRIAENDWDAFLVKVLNEAGVTAPLAIASGEQEIEVSVYGDRPLNPKLSGLSLEYRLLLVRAKTSGDLASVLTADIGAGTQDLGFRADLLTTFDVQPTHEVTISLVDEKGEPTTAALEIRDEHGRVWPSQARRVEPDFRFQPQIYRNHGEKIRLPDGDYSIETTRGPEYLPHGQQLLVGADPRQPPTIRVELERWIDPAAHGWWSGDHHIHAAGCKHYTSPSEGVHAAAMLRHCRGEDLKVGANLTWGPCFDYQKQFFTGKTDTISDYPYLLRYDVEVSGFGSHNSGHLCLLRLRDQIYPGGDSKHHWPTLCLNTLKWAQKQGAVCGPAHSGWGLKVETDELPNLLLPPFDGIGACEYIVDVTHEVEGPEGKPVPAVDFISMCDTPYVWELNIWYHTLNCGFRTRISGETDFPCIYGERVGLGRSYIKLDDRLDYEAWCEGISRGRGYVSDGRSHLIDMTVNGVEIGTAASEIVLEEPGPVTVKAQVAAYLPEFPSPDLSEVPYDSKPFWHVERARIPDTRKVLVELVQNGLPIASQEIAADGSLTEVAFEEIDIQESSWLALRILATSHTNPMFILVGDRPIRASRESAEWCLRGVDQCWSEKERHIAPAELGEARAAYDHARKTYRNVIGESL